MSCPHSFTAFLFFAQRALAALRAISWRFSALTFAILPATILLTHSRWVSFTSMMFFPSVYGAVSLSGMLNLSIG